jgi:hypothetical protein
MLKIFKGHSASLYKSTRQMFRLIISPFHHAKKMKGHGNDRIHAFEKRRRNQVDVCFPRVQREPFLAPVFYFMDNGLYRFVKVKYGIYGLEGKLPPGGAWASP